MTALHIWTVYDHPRDFPAAYVARLYIARADRVERTNDLMFCADVEAIRAELSRRGFTRMERHPSDDANIMETWI